MKEGDKARIIAQHGGHEFKIGQIVTITETEDQEDTLSIKPESVRCDNKWGCNLDEIELIVGMCDCGRPLLPCYDAKGKRIGVTHSSEDEEYHLVYWSNDKLKERKSSN